MSDELTREERAVRGKRALLKMTERFGLDFLYSRGARSDAEIIVRLVDTCDAIEDAWASLAEDILGEAPETPEQQRAAIAAAFAAYRAPFELCDQCMTASIEHDVHSPSHTFVGSGEYIDAETYTAGGDHG